MIRPHEFRLAALLVENLSPVPPPAAFVPEDEPSREIRRPSAVLRDRDDIGELLDRLPDEDP